MVKTTWLTANELIEKIGKGRLSKWQIEAWRKQGLLPQHQRKSLGRGKGTETRYPPETVDQIRFILKLKREDRIRNLTDIQTWLWIEGFSIKTSLIKGNLLKLAKGFQGLSVSSPKEISNKIKLLLSGEANALKAFGLRVDKNQKADENLLRLFIILISGFAIDFNSETNHADYETAYRLEEVIGIERARTDRLARTNPWLSGIPGDYIASLSEMKLLSAAEIINSVRQSSDDELETVRKDLKSFLNLIRLLGILPEIYTKRFGVAAIKKYSQWGRKHITLVFLLFVHLKYKKINWSALIPDFTERADEIQVLGKVDMVKRKATIKKMRKRVDRN